VGNIRPLEALLSKDHWIYVAGFTGIFFNQDFNIAVFVFQENMFSFEVEKERYALKPMNCPGHWYVFITIVLMVRAFCLKGLHYLGPYYLEEHQICKETISQNNKKFVKKLL